MGQTVKGMGRNWSKFHCTENVLVFESRVWRAMGCKVSGEVPGGVRVRDEAGMRGGVRKTMVDRDVVQPNDKLEDVVLMEVEAVEEVVGVFRC